MVVHTPTKLDVLRQTAAERRAAGRDAEGEDVPPSVQAATQDAAVDGAGAVVPPQGDVVGVQDGVVPETVDKVNVLHGEDLVLPTAVGDAADDIRGAHIEADVIVRTPGNIPPLPPPTQDGLGLSLIHI